MNKEFIPYEQALELKELGFKKDNDFGLLYKGDDIPSILYQQAFRWFREKHGLCIVIKPIADKKLDLGYNLLKNGLIMNAHLTYEGAELACLRNLIKIVKTYGGGEQ